MRRAIQVASGLLVILIGLAIFQEATASRNSSGTMAAINGPYIAGTTISSSVINARLADIESEMTDSLSRSGKGGMTAALRGADATVAAPEFSFTNDTGSGLYRIGSNNIGFAINGSKRQDWTTTGTTVTGTLGVTSDVAVNTNKFTVAASSGNTLVAGTLAATGASSLTGNVGVGGAADANFPLYVSSIYGNTNAKFGSTVPLYIVSNNAAIGFNSYYNSSYKAGTTGYTGDVFLDPSNGQMKFETSATSITADAAASPVTRVIVSPSGLIIGATGTAISASYRGTVVLSLGTIAASSCSANSITVTGATAGADCALGMPTGYTSTMVTQCRVTANSCAFTICNVDPVTGVAMPASATYSCRVFNP